MFKRCSRAALLLRNCLPEGVTHPFALPKHIHPLALVIGSSGIEGSDLMDVKDGEEMRLAESWEGFIIPDMKVDWLGSRLEVLSSSSSSVEKLVRLLEPEKLALVKLELVEVFASVE